MSTQPSDEQMDAIADALAAGRKIEAIKIHREATGMGLKDSKDFIEALIPRLKEEDPERFAALGTKGGGCASAALALLTIVLGAAGAAGLVRLMS